jgi:hypothetical protein
VVEEVRNDVQEELGIPASHVAVFVTHTHTGPYTATIFGHPPDTGYLLALRRKIAECVRLASDRMEPCEIGLASTLEHSISFNRRYVMTDGLVRTHPARGSDELSHVEGPMDPEVGVMCLRHDDGRTAGHVVNFACHPNVVGGNQVSADFPGALSRALKRQSGEACVTLFGNGASGNICQIDVNNPDKEVHGPAWSERMGEVLANDVAEILPKMEFAATAILEVASRVISIPRRDPDRTPYHGTMFSGPTLKEVDLLYSREQEKLRRRLREEPYVDFEIQALRIGDAALVMIPAELFVEFGLDLKRRSPLQPTYVITLANGSHGYVPTPHAFERGGYEVRTGPVSLLTPEAGDQIVTAALGLLAELAAP